MVVLPVTVAVEVVRDLTAHTYQNKIKQIECSTFQITTNTRITATVLGNVYFYERF